MLNNIGLPGLLLIAVVVLVLFGKGKVSSLMGEIGVGIKAFQKGLKEPDGGAPKVANDPAPTPLEPPAPAEEVRKTL